MKICSKQKEDNLHGTMRVQDRHDNLHKSKQAGGGGHASSILSLRAEQQAFANCSATGGDMADQSGENESRKKPPHLILFPFPAQGHALPALMLAHRLIENGADVTFVTLSDRLARIQEALGEEQNRIRLLPMPGILPAEDSNERGHDTREALDPMISHCNQSRPHLERFLKEIRAAANEESTPGAPSCIVSDKVLGWTQDVANEFGIPRYIFYPAPACVLAVVFHVKTLLEGGLLPIKTEDESEVRVPGMPPIQTRHMHSLLIDTTPKEAVEFYARNCVRVHEASGILINTFQELEMPALLALQDQRALNPNKVPIFPVGPLFLKGLLNQSTMKPRTLLPYEERCLHWLKDQPPSSVLYVSFGSLLMLTQKQIQELAAGLESSEQRFLWILRSSTPSSDLNGVLPHGFLSRTCTRGLVMSDWAPQLLILSNSSTGGFLTHCGWNSTLENLGLGVPMLTMPSFSDQALNSRRIVDQLQVGMELREGANGLVERGEVERSVRILMGSEQGNQTRSKAKELMSAAAKASDATSMKSLDAFIKHLTEISV